MLDLAESRWHNQIPDTPVEIDWNHDLAPRLLFVASGAARGYDMVTGRYPSSGSFSNKNGRFGEALGFGGTTQLAYPHADDVKLASGYTLLVFGRTTSLAAQSGMVSKWDGGGNNVPGTFFVRANGELALWRNVGGGNNGTYGTATGAVVTNRDFVASVDADGFVLSTPNLYLDGSKRSGSFTFGPSGSNVALSEPAGSTFAIGTSNSGTSTWQGHLYLVVAISGRVTGDEQLDLHEYPGQLFRRDVRRTYCDLGSAINLVIAEALHAHAADSLTLTQQHVLAVADAAHAHTVDNVTLTQAHTLAIAEALHDHAAENVVLSVAGTLGINDALHAHAADNLVLTQAHNLVLADAAHAHTADNLALTQAHILAIQEALHAHTADNLTLAIGGTTLAIAEALHAHAADNLLLTQLNILVISDTLHAHLADTLTLALPGATILHDRVLFIRGETRTLALVAQTRNLTVH
jgi:hypothetical protein